MQISDITDAYLQTLALQRKKPTLAFLGEITRRHVRQFAFSSIGPILGDELPLDITSLYQRIVKHRRGGYCFEQNGLLFEVLQELGFSVSLYLGRVIYNRDIHPGLTHRISLVEFHADRYLADVGFGPLGPRKPVAMSGDESQEDHRVFRIAEQRPGEFHMQTLKDGEYFSLYRFELARYGQADCDLGHFYSHRHPEAGFVKNLVASRIMDTQVFSLRNRDFSVIDKSGAQQQLVKNGAQLHTILTTLFDLNITLKESEALFDKTR